MENSSRIGDRTWFFCCFLMTVLLMFRDVRASDDRVIKKIRDPTSNVNLPPFIQWLSAYECTLNKSDSCPDKYQLSGKGWVNVTQADTQEYCSSGCAEHTRAVLMCISLVKRDYKFVDKTTVKIINGTITHGCNKGFTGHVWIDPASSAVRFSVSKLAIFATASLLFLMNM